MRIVLTLIFRETYRGGKNELAATLQTLQPNKSEVIKDNHLVEILEIDTKEETNNDETSMKDNEVKSSAEVASDNLGVNDEVKKTPEPEGDQKYSTLPRDDPSLRDDHTEILNKANTLRTLSKVRNSNDDN